MRKNLIWGAFLALLLAAIYAVYLPSMDAPFYLDDFPNIVENSSIQAKSDDITGGLTYAVKGSPLKTRPLAYITFRFNYLFFGLDARAFRIVNVLVHMLSSLLIFLIFRRIFTWSGSGVKDGDEDMVALAGASIWALHPLGSSSVVYIVQRMNGCMTFFLLLSLYLFMRGWDARGKKWFYFLSGIFALILAAGFKENAVIFPFLAYGLYASFYAGDEREDGPGKRRFVVGTGLLLFIVGLAGFFMAAAYSYPRYEGVRSFTMWERLLTEARVIPLYLSLFALPLSGRFFLEYDFPISRSLIDPPTTITGIVLIIFLFLGAVILFKRWRIASFGIFWFLLSILPESSVWPLELVFEHRMYFPMVGLSLALAWGIYILAKRMKSPSSSLHRLTYTAIACLILLFVSVNTVQRCRLWANPLKLFAQNLERYPGKERLYTGLSYYQLMENDLKGVMETGERALKRFPSKVDESMTKIRNNMAISSIRQGDLEKGVAILQSIVGDGFQSPQVYYNLGSAYLDLNQPDRAISALKKSLELGGRTPLVYRSLGEAYTRVKQYKPAVRMYESALKMNPGDGEAIFQLAKLHYVRNEWEGAEKYFRLRLNTTAFGPPDFTTLFQAGYTFMRRGRYGEGERAFLRAETLSPDNPELHYNLACLYSLSGRVDKSIYELGKSVGLGLRNPVIFSDPDLENIRGRDEYRKILEKLR